MAAGRAVDPEDLPASLVRRPPGRERITVDGLPMLAVARPVAGNAVYVELFPLQQLNRTFAFLSAVLIGGTVAVRAARARRWGRGRRSGR